MAPVRTYDRMTALKNQTLKSEHFVLPHQLQAGDEFYVVSFTVSDGVTVKMSGVFLGDHGGGQFYVHLDGEEEPTIRMRSQISFFDQPVMVILLRSLTGLTVDVDMRSDKAKAVADARTA